MLKINFTATSTVVNGVTVGNQSDSSRYERVQIGDAIKTKLFGK